VHLPDAAQACVDRIQAFLAEAQALGLDTAANDDAYALRMTAERYLPETLDAYERIPAALRTERDPVTGNTPDEQLLEQLEILERATAQRLAGSAQSARTALSANGRFLTERLGSAESLPQAPPIEPGRSPVAARRFADVIAAGAKKNSELVEAVAQKLQAAFPLLIEVDRGMFGSGRAKRIAITVPLGNDRLRYQIALGRAGDVEATCSKIVRGVVIRTESVPFDMWAQALFEDLQTYANSSIQAQEMLQNLVR
jgi:hypothetical protein